jgi:hypothetical protein
MADIMSILSSSYSSAALTTPSNTPYVAVDPDSYKGNWDGTYNNGQTFKFSISNVSGFRAQVKYQSGTTVKYQSVLIKDSSFRIGDSKFTLSSAGQAAVKTVITDPVTSGTSVISGNAAQET